MCPRDKSPLTFKRICPKDGKEIPWQDVVRGFEVQKGKYVTITQKELENLEIRSGRLVEIFQFVDADKLDPIYFDSSYYLVPDENGEKPYFLKLVEAKMKGQEEVVELRVPEIKPTKNLMEALRASIKTHERR